MSEVRKTKTATLLFFCIVLSYFAAGCSANRYREPITKFQAASAVVSADARKSFSEINRLDRNLAIKKLTRDKVFITAATLKRVQPFTPDELQARLDALDRLNQYVDLLVRIANSDAPQNISKSATDLTGAMSNLVVTIGGLSGNTNGNFKTKTTNAFGVAGVIVSEVLSAFVKHKIKEGVEAAVLRGEKPINELIDAIGDDLDAINRDYLATFGRERDNFFKLYNCELNKVIQNPELTDCSKMDTAPFNQGLLNSYRDQIISIEDTLETLRSANPNESLAKMKKAHTKIVTLAQTNSPANFAEAVAAIEDFAAAAGRLGTAVEKLKNS